jgi:hypothetical protein
MGFNGIYRGTVVNAADPTARGRVQVRVPAVPGGQTQWAPVCRPFGAVPGGATGSASVGRDVWVMFEAGDPARPVVLGMS